MTRKQKLAQAWVDLNCYRWNDYLGDPPEGWEDNNSRDTIIWDIMKKIEAEIGGEKATSRAWWKYHLHRSWIRWVIWYYIKRERY